MKELRIKIRSSFKQRGHRLAENSFEQGITTEEALRRFDSLLLLIRHN